MISCLYRLNAYFYLKEQEDRNLGQRIFHFYLLIENNMELDHLLHLIILDKLIVRYLHDNIKTIKV